MDEKKALALLDAALPEKVTRLERIVCAIIRSESGRNTNHVEVVALARALEKEMDKQK